MQVQPVKFTASGQVGTPAFSRAVISPLSGKTFTPVDGSATVSVPDMPQRVVGVAYKGFTAVTGYNGNDNTGDVVFVAGGAGTYSFSYEVNCQKGLYIEVTGTGSGTVWLA